MGSNPTLSAKHDAEHAEQYRTDGHPEHGQRKTVEPTVSVFTIAHTARDAATARRAPVVLPDALASVAPDWRILNPAIDSDISDSNLGG